MKFHNLKSSVQKFWIWLCRQWAEAEATQKRIEAERLKTQERYGSDFPGRWF